MAEGRFVSRSIAHDLALNAVSLEADYLFTRCVPFLDREGRMEGHPAVVRAKVCPMREEMGVDEVQSALAELQGEGLVRWYEAEGRAWLAFPGFEKNQKGLRKDREAASEVPPPDEGDPVEVPEAQLTMLDSPAERNGSGPAPEDDGSPPAEVEVKGSKGKGREGKYIRGGSGGDKERLSGEERAIEDAVEEVFEHCRERRTERLGDLPGPSIQLTDRRRTKIRARLKEALEALGSPRRAVAYLCLAADGFYADDWSKRDDYLDMAKYLYDDAERVSKWARKALEAREGLDSDVRRRARSDLDEMREKYG